MTDVLAYGAGAREAAGDGTALLAKLDAARQRLAAPFAPERIELVASVAEALLGPRRAAASGPAAHFAFWTRRAALQKLAKSFAARVPENTLARPRGLVFHLPPQNVETVFLYSWALAYLAGNANIVRLPQEISARMRAIVDLFLDRLAAAGDESQLFVHYPSQGDLGAKISAVSDARVVWGGDAKVALFAPLPLRNGGKSIWFGDRFSFSAVNGAALGELDEPALTRAREEAAQRRVRLRPDGLLVAPCALCRRRSREPLGGGAAPPRRVRARMDDGRSEGPGRPRDRQDDGCVLRGGNGTRLVGQLAEHEPHQRRRQRAGAAGAAGRRRFPERRLHPRARRRRDLHPRERPDDHLFRLGPRPRSKRSPPRAQDPACRAGRRSEPRSTSISSGTATTSRSS